jgi:hypothetical protein
VDYEVVGKPILIALPDAFKLRTGTEATVTGPTRALSQAETAIDKWKT